MGRPWHFSRLALLLGLVILVGGCAGSGPKGRDLISAGSEPNSPFALVDITDESLDVVSSWHRPSLGAMFGDYRAPKIQRVDVGDTVQINIWETGSGGLFATPAVDGLRGGSRSSSIPDQVIARDGTVNVPYAGRIRVAGKTPQEIEQLIVKGLEGKTADPQAMVSLTRNLSNAATVTGDVTNGALVPLSPKGDKLLDVIAQAGGIKAPVHEAFITLSRDGTSLSVPLQAILSSPGENVYVRASDVITVYRAPQSFTAIGATDRNAVVPFDAGGITLEEAMGKSGGLLDGPIRSTRRVRFALRARQSGPAVSQCSAAPVGRQRRACGLPSRPAGSFVPVPSASVRHARQGYSLCIAGPDHRDRKRVQARWNADRPSCSLQSGKGLRMTSPRAPVVVTRTWRATAGSR